MRKVVSLSTLDDMIGEEDYFLVQKFLHQIPSDKDSLEELRKVATRNPLYRGRLISEDGTTAAIVVFVYEKQEDETYRKRLVENTFSLLKRHDPSGERFHVAGWTLMNLRLSQYMKKDTAIFIPLVYIIVMATILIIFRDIRITLLAFINVSLCLSCTMGFIAIIGSTLNNVTSIIPPLIMALSLADTVHVFSHYLSNAQAGFDRKQALVKTLQEVYKPCLLTTVTTMAGFISLRVSHVPLIKEFALVAAMGVLLAFLFSFLFLPSAIMLFPLSAQERGSSSIMWIDFVLKGVITLQKRYGRTILIACTLFTGAAILSISHIRVETDLMTFFKKDDHIRQTTDFIQEHLAGIVAVDVSIEANARDAFKKPENLKFIEEAQNFVGSLPEIDTVNSLADYVKDMNESFHNEDSSFYTIPETKELITQYFLLYDSDDIGDFINPSFDHARIMARTDRHSTADQKMLIDKINAFLKQETPAGLTARVTGGVTQGVKVANEMVRGQVASLSVAVVVISAMMFLVFRSFSLGLLSVVPNMFPILMNFGIMGLLGIPLNTATALISAVAIGIAVDDTIHFLHQYREERNRGLERSGAIENTIRIKGRAIITTSIILAFGFGVLLLSSFTPTIQFGALAALIMLTALAGDLLFLPAILGLKVKFLP